MIRKLLLFQVLAGFAVTATSNAASVYSSKSAYIDATSDVLVTGFDDFVGDYMVEFPGPTLVINDRLTLSTDSTLKIFGAGVFGENSPDAFVDADGFSTTLTFTFAPGVKSVGFDYGTMHNASPNMVINVFSAVDNELVFTSGYFAGPYTLQNPYNFFGYEDVNGIGRVEISGAHGITADNIYMAVPEPASAVLMALGGVALLRRRR